MDIVIAGAGGHGRIVLEIVRAAGTCNPIGFLDANTALHGTSVGGLPVLGHLNLLPKLIAKGLRGAIVAIGDNHVRASYGERLAAAGLELVNAVHPSAVVSTSAALGRNIIIAAGAIVCAEARLGDHVIINTGATVDHECVIEPAVHICPGVHLAGRVTVGEGAFVGIGANVLPCLTIGARAVVGGGALVRRDVPAQATVAGVPARVIKSPAASLAV